MQISIHPKVRKILIAVLVAAVLGIAFLALRPVLFPPPASTPTGLSPDAQAAVNAVSAFYTLNHHESIDLWAARLCAIATEAGCRAIKDYFAPNVQALVQKNQIQTGCTVEPIQMVVDKNHRRIWQVHVTLDHPWQELETPSEDVYVELMEADGKWLMNRILFEQEAELLVTPTP